VFTPPEFVVPPAHPLTKPLTALLESVVAQNVAPVPSDPYQKPGLGGVEAAVVGVRAMAYGVSTAGGAKSVIVPGGMPAPGTDGVPVEPAVVMLMPPELVPVAAKLLASTVVVVHDDDGVQFALMETVAWPTA
jgi:hypothetical protein